MEVGNSLELNNNACKNAIMQNIREALASHSPISIPNIDKKKPLFDPIEDQLKQFTEAFSRAGGKCVIFDLDSSMLADKEYARKKIGEVYKYVKTEVELGKYNTVLNTSPRLSQVLQAYTIPFVEVLSCGEVADVAIAYAEFLIARTGHLVFSQRNDQMRYPSIQSLAKNLIVLSSASKLLPDLSSLLSEVTATVQDENTTEQRDLQLDMMEMVRPERHDTITPSFYNQQVTLILIVER